MNDRMTIAEASRLSGLSPETIRHYERLGILHPDRNEQTGYRYYSLRDICLLGKIQSFLQCGFSLKEIKRMIDVCKAQFPEYYCLFILAILTGARLGEYSAIRSIVHGSERII